MVLCLMLEHTRQIEASACDILRSNMELWFVVGAELILYVLWSSAGVVIMF